MIDFDKIIQPINEENPCGIDIRSEPLEVYSKLKDTRVALRRQERHAIEVEQNLSIDKQGWKEVIPLAETILCEHSKDIEAAAWLAEALVRAEGIEGLEVGLRILVELFTTYGNQIYPKIDEGPEASVEDKVMPIATLGGKYEAGTLIAPIYFANLINTTDNQSYSAWQIKEFLSGGKNSTHSKVTKDKVLECDELKPIINNVNKKDLANITEKATSCIEQFKKLNSMLSKLFGSSAPNLNNLGNVVNYCFEIVTSISSIFEKEIVEDTSEENNDNLNAPEDNADKINSNLISLDNLELLKLDKSTALRLLEMLTKYFRETEPHSPISYSLERASYWSTLSLPELLCDLVPESTREEFCKYTGIPFLDNEDADGEE